MVEPPSSFEAEIGRSITQALEELMTEKHLYQSVQLPYDLDLLRKVRVDPKSDMVCRFAATEQLRYLSSSWMPCWSESHSGVAEKAGWTRFSTPRIKIFCDHCDTIYPFISTFPEGADAVAPIPTLGFAQDQQVLFLPYQCQGCLGEGVPVIFMVTRKGLRLTLSGRSRMETVAVPKYLPKNTRHFYQKARIAYNSGQTLAALFLLRTFIEQQMRNEVKDPDPRLPGDQLGDKYNALQEPEVKSAAPSLKEQYSTLSDAIHKADESAPFEGIEKRVLAHFEYRDTHKRTKVLRATIGQ
jgi:hypothetical protein